jgi:hypothetical protein
MNNNIFDVLNWIFKSKKENPDGFSVSTYVLNRWISMASEDCCNIVNITLNRWCLRSQKIPVVAFYRAILPKKNNRINYIKKIKKEKLLTEDDIKSLAENVQLSIKEIKFLESQLEHLNSVHK